MKKIVFDLDDTLYKSKELRALREKEILKLVGNNLESYNELKKTKTTTEAILSLGIKKEEFFKAIDAPEPPFSKDEKLKEILTNLKKSYEIIVLSNSTTLGGKKVLEKLGIINIIDRYYSAEDFKNSKPAEECFFMVSKGDICVGNNFRKDLQVPKNRGGITIHIGEKPHPEADFNITNIYEIDNILHDSKNLNNPPDSYSHAKEKEEKNK